MAQPAPRAYSQKMQAALYFNRKRRLRRIAAQNTPTGPQPTPGQALSADTDGAYIVDTDGVYIEDKI